MHKQSQTTVGIIGCGAMGGAILSGLHSAGGYALHGYDPNPQYTDAFAAQGICMHESAESLAKACQVLVLAVKPYMVPKVLAAIKPQVQPEALVISIAAGQSLEVMRKVLGEDTPLVRVMPNTPALVGAGLFALCFDDPRLQEAPKTFVRQMFASLGQCLEIEESRMNAFTAIAGCGPAYVFYVMDAIAEAAVTLGFSRTEAQELSRGLFSGSALLAQHTQKHFAVLREDVCSPAGVTIAAMNHLDRKAVRGHFVDAVLAAFAKGAQ